jgi:MYXO-CTERM domain-containing protein
VASSSRTGLRALALAALLTFALLPSRAGAQIAEHAFIFVIDGVRAAEGFDDPLRQYIAPLHELLPHGSLLTFMENQTLTTTMPAHFVLVSGNASNYGLTMPYWGRQYFHPHTPTLFEIYRQRTGAPAESCWVLSNTPQIYDANASLMPGYGQQFGAERRIQFDDEMPDEWAWMEIDSLMADHEIDLMLVNFHEVDRVAHWGDWAWHTEALQRTSRDIADFWFALQQDPIYADNTVLIVTTDHGRHLDQQDDGWMSHGCSCQGCRKTFFLALGPGIKQGYVSDETYSQKDVAPTVAHLMGLPFPYARGRVLNDILVDEATATGGVGGDRTPRLAAAGDLVVMVSESQSPNQPYSDGGFKVRVDLSEDHGETWETEFPAAGTAMQRNPQVWTDGDVVLVNWYSYSSASGEWLIHLWRLGPERTDWETVLEEPIAGIGTPVGNISILDEDGMLYLLQDSPPDELFRTWVSEDRGVTWFEDGVYEADERHFPTSASQVQVGDVRLVTFSANVSFDEFGQDNDNTEVYWITSEDGGENWDGEFRVTDNVKPSIQPVPAVTPDGVVHVVWSDLATGEFQINHATSTDEGASFSEPAKLTSAETGAWEPAVAVDGQRLYIAWSEVLGADSAVIRTAAVTPDGVVQERIVSSSDGMARNPTLVPLGDGHALVAWSESQLDGPWELRTAEVVTAGVPATEATATVSPTVLPPGVSLLFIDLELTIGDDDRGVDRFEITLPAGFGANGFAELEVDGEPADAEAWIEGEELWLEAAEVILDDGAQVVITLEVEAPAIAAEAADLAVTLHHGEEPYTTPASGALAVSVEVTDSVTPPLDEGCECATTDTAPRPHSVLALLGLALLAIRRRGQR